MGELHGTRNTSRYTYILWDPLEFERGRIVRIFAVPHGQLPRALASLGQLCRQRGTYKILQGYKQALELSRMKGHSWSASDSSARKNGGPTWDDMLDASSATLLEE
ncbi:hypothetical protein MOQ72_37310 [Saccharopolyspora sp. K220]|uniref:hypothetical protein n=1 Tax=Saccharopolyspora soli TaxID=2926618 RepID=UPI001F585C14|nr:hypothetical protein [Saccharopolyspora soli]MCI2423092.1 hypothetical protein [Saccharopolyspora soli]